MNEASTKKQQFWLDHIEAANSSGLSIVQYAKQHDIKAQSLYQWRNAMRHKPSTVSTQDTFTRVVTSTPLTCNRVTLRIREATFEFDTLPDPQWVSTLIGQVAEHQ